MKETFINHHSRKPQSSPSRNEQTIEMRMDLFKESANATPLPILRLFIFDRLPCLQRVVRFKPPADSYIRSEVFCFWGRE
jgi:hypothetical protein